MINTRAASPPLSPLPAWPGDHPQPLVPVLWLDRLSLTLLPSLIRASLPCLPPAVYVLA